MNDRYATTGRSPKSKPCSRFRSPTSCSAPRKPIARNHQPNAVQMSTLLSIKTGACPEDCAYCPQSVRYETGLEREKLVPLDEVRARAQAAKDAGATRFCMGAAWRSPKKKDVEAVAAMIREVRALGMETCATLGMLTPEQAHELKDAGLDYYNHNVDTSPEFYGEIITTRTYQDRLDTLAAVRDAGLNVCCGGIVGMGETTRDRASMLATLANLPQHPESVPINQLVRVPGTPLAGAAPVDPFDFVRTIAVARIVDAQGVRASVRRPRSHGRRTAGAVFPRRREFDFLRRETADHGQSRRGARSRVAHAPRNRAAGAAGARGRARRELDTPSMCTAPTARTGSHAAPGQVPHATRPGSAEGRARRSRAAQPQTHAAGRAARRPHQFLQQRLPGSAHASRGGARVQDSRRRIRRRQRRVASGDRVTAPNTKRSSRSSRRLPVAKRRWSSPRATWPTWASLAH